MKIKRALCLLFVLVLIGATAAFASVDGEEIEVFLNNSPIDFNGTSPYISSGGVAMVPLRKIANELGLEVAWSENSSQTVTVTGGKTIEFNLSGKAARVNGTAEYLPEKPQIIDNKAYVPLRFLCETLMLDVEFSAPNRVYLA